MIPVPSLESAAATGFRLQLRQGSRGPVLHCQGKLEGVDCEQRIGPELDRLHEALISTGAGVATLDVREVDYLSSSALKRVAGWFMKVAASQAYVIHIAYHPDREWQTWSLGALRMLAPGRIRLEAVAAGPTGKDPAS